MLGLFGSSFVNDEYDKRPGQGITSMTYSIPEGCTPEVAQRIHQAMQDKQKLSWMSPREQLNYLKTKMGL